MLRLTIRATDGSVPSAMLKLMQERLAQGISTVPEHREPTRQEISDAFGSVMVS
jgi:AP-2 complex subunit alpha